MSLLGLVLYNKCSSTTDGSLSSWTIITFTDSSLRLKFSAFLSLTHFERAFQLFVRLCLALPQTLERSNWNTDSVSIFEKHIYKVSVCLSLSLFHSPSLSFYVFVCLWKNSEFCVFWDVEYSWKRSRMCLFRSNVFLIDRSQFISLAGCCIIIILFDIPPPRNKRQESIPGPEGVDSVDSLFCVGKTKGIFCWR